MHSLRLAWLRVVHRSCCGSTFASGLRWVSYLSVHHYALAVLTAAADPSGMADPRYSPLGIGANLGIMALIALAYKLLLYVALQWRGLSFD